MENVYSQSKIFHFHDKLANLAEKKVTPPVHVRMKPINACNHRCFYCCYRNKDLYLGQRMNEKDMIPREKMQEIVGDLARSGVKAVTFTGGGEPLIYPYICETIDSLAGRNIKVAVLTNGGMLKGEVADILARTASWVRVSIDSTDGPTLEKSRGVKPDEFDRIIQNIRSFSKMKHPDCELGINFIITRDNAGDVYRFIGLMKDSGADHVKISECIVSTNGDENKRYHSGHFDAVMAAIHRAEDTLADSSFHVINKFHDFDDKFEKKYRSCPFIHFLNVIAADQHVYSCQDKAYTDSGILGSLENMSLAELWASEGYRQKLAAINPSRHCDHHCVAHGKNMTLHDYLSTDKRHLEFV